MTSGDHGTPDGYDARPGQPIPAQPWPGQPQPHYGQPGTPQGPPETPQGRPDAAPYGHQPPHGHQTGPVYGHRPDPAHDDQPATPYGHQPPSPYGHQPTAPYGHQPAPLHGHPGAPYGGPDPQAAWAAERERSRRRRGRRVAVAVTGGVLTAAVAAGAVLLTGDDEDPAAAPATTRSTTSEPSGSPAVPRVDIGEPSNAPSALPSLLARPVIGAEQAFPKETVTLEDGSVYERVDMATTTDCARGMSAELAELIEQGEPCARMTAALFTDADRRSQVTVSVLSFDRPGDASRVFAMASMDPVTYQVVSLDPAPGAGLPTVPPGSPGLFERLMTVRSVVFANGQWGDGAETGEAELTRQTQGLLQYVNDDVLAYEENRPKE
ncbi:hypothetical protein [Streptomyces sp. NPDC005017]|uniref:hypothetical protein n=1 Tax=Streptomyces sp. NPDC005017 TaxID=3364706 RepID=UPI00367E952F